MKIFKDKTYEIKSESGMTLIELIVVMVLISILAGFISKIIFYEINVYEMIADRKDELQSSRYAFHVMTRDIRQMLNPESIFHASGDSLTFDDIDTTTISYKYQNGEIHRSGDLLVNGVSDFHFYYFDDAGNPLDDPVVDPTEIRVIELNLSNTVHSQVINSKIKVTPRNFLNAL